MIKKSLQDLRQKLDVMRRDKEAVEAGINEYETKISHHWKTLTNTFDIECESYNDC